VSIGVSGSDPNRPSGPSKSQFQIPVTFCDRAQLPEYRDGTPLQDTILAIERRQAREK
jgi:hypothetical protein